MRASDLIIKLNEKYTNFVIKTQYIDTDELCIKMQCGTIPYQKIFHVHRETLNKQDFETVCNYLELEMYNDIKKIMFQ